MAEEKPTRFIRRNGRIIPIRSALQAARATRVGISTAKVGLVGASAHRLYKKASQGGLRNPFKSEIKVNKGLDALGLGLSVGSGVLGAATFSGGAKSFISGMVGGHVLDAAAIGANIGSVAGKGRQKDRAKQAAKQEARNMLIGNAVFLGGLVSTQKNRTALKGTAKKLIGLARKVFVR